MDELLQELHLEKYKNSKLTLKKVLCISKEDADRSAWKTTPSWRFLKKLIALDGAARNTRLDEFEEEPITGFTTEENVLEAFDMSSRALSLSVHPLDVICALMNCSDSFLQQEIVTKMAMCQFAVPLLLPSGDGLDCTFMLWAMRNIIKRWRPPSLLSIKGFKEENITNISMPVFSFVRMGNCCLSKSRVLNKILIPTNTYIDFFVYQDMECGYRPRTISEGLLEMSWYFPGGNENSNVFPEPIAVTNLRGDLISNQKQFQFLTNMSSAVFVFSEDIQEEHCNFLKRFTQGNPSYFFIICPQKGQEKTKENRRSLSALLNIKMNNILVKDSSINEAEIVKQIQAIMRSITKSSSDLKHLAGLEKDANRFEILVDESSSECHRAKERAMKICRKIQNVPQYKKETLILQRDLWSQITKNQKELCRMRKQDDVDVEGYKSKLISQNAELRNQQRQQGLQGDIKTFQKDLIQLSSTEKIFFLKWMKFLLDDIARSNLSELHVQYLKYSTNMTELKRIDRQITDSSLGIENFLRELGQIHEARNHSDLKENYENLPEIAADLLLEGIPLEVIDGDTSSIPLKWITDVLNQLDAKTGKRCTMRVITVVGVQSTGKSTLLNTMFGLQFPVASGRCTRGAFMTLLKVNKNFRKELGCEFILVIDTEGLKAPELASLEDSHEHDNELATFVVGLSDITIINMAMENTTEMKEILQIVVHAFLRMKEIGKKPSCQFVHQNVSDVSAHENNMRDRKKLLEQLDEMTRVAADMEKKCGIACFSDVMDYDPVKHSWYIPGLWQGVPPMAPVNFGYSENIYELKLYLLELLKSQNSISNRCKIPDFIAWTKSLWSAVKHEKFIFSFRNSLVAEAYTKLSIQYSKWEWNFTKNVHSWMTTTETHIRNQNSAASLNDDMISQFKGDLQNLVLKEESALLQLLETYFDNKCENVHLIERYKGDFFMSVKFHARELERNSHVKLIEAVSIQKGKFKILDIHQTSRKLIEKKLTTLLRSCRERHCELADIDADKEFEEMWKKTLSDLQIEELRRRNIGQTILRQLKNEMCVKGGGVNEHLNKVMSLDHYRNDFVSEKSHIEQSYFSYSRNRIYVKQELLDKIEDLAMTLIDLCDTYIKEKADNTGDYDDTYFEELLQMINDKLKDETNTKLHFSPKFELDVKLYIFGKASKAFQDIHERFIQENDPKICLEKLKPQYLAMFESIFHEKDVCQGRAKQFCELCLKPALTDYILRHLGQEIIEDIMQSSDHRIFGSRSSFQLAILQDLLERKEFEHYWSYINRYKSYLEDWIYNHITKRFQSAPTLKTLEEKILSSIVRKTKKVLKSKECLEAKEIVEFLESFCKLLDTELVISQNEITVITFHNTANVQQFSEDILFYLPSIKEDILSDTNMLDIKHILSRVTLKPQGEFLKKVIGCGKQCPFCKVPCENTGGDHQEHAASLHRPQGLGMYRWIGDGTLITEICSTSVVSNAQFRNSDTKEIFHPYKDYRTYYADWAIQPDANLKSSDYWRHVFVIFNNEFATKYDAKPAELPEDWKEITKEQALASLQESFKIK